MSKKGLFIAFEGGEGCGKSTLMASICQALQQHSQPYIAVREPGGTALGEAIRALLLNKKLDLHINAKAELCLFLAARSQNIAENIAPALAEGKVVLADRFNASTMAYQGFARKLGLDLTASLCHWIAGDVTPDQTFYLDIDPEIGLQRTLAIAKEHAAAGSTDRLESEQIDFHRAVREGFLQLAEKLGGQFITVDASLSKLDIFNIVWPLIGARLGLV